MPAASAVLVAITLIRSINIFSSSVDKARMVPNISTCSGIMLDRLPPWIEPIVTTPAFSVTLRFRLTMVCNELMICADTTIGSIDSHG